MQTPTTQGRKRASPPPISDIPSKKAAIQPPATPPATVAPNQCLLGKAAIKDILDKSHTAKQPPATPLVTFKVCALSVCCLSIMLVSCLCMLLLCASLLQGHHALLCMLLLSPSFKECPHPKPASLSTCCMYTGFSLRDFIQAAEKVGLPADPITTPNWSDFTELHMNAMHIMFSADRGGADVVNSIRALANEAAGLTKRLATETDADFLRLTQEKLDKANGKLAEKMKDFEKEPSCELYNTFREFSKKSGGPAFDLNFADLDGPV